jgi:glycosyltransferase involved in cell wall biosynthesis
MLTNKLLYLASEDWAFARHFLVMARTARAVGFDVVVAVRVMCHGPEIAGEGFRLAPISFTRGSAKSVVAFAAIRQLLRVIRREKPNIVHCIGLPMVIFGGIAAKLAGVRTIVLAPTGLGHLWTTEGRRSRIVQTVVRILIRWVLNGKNSYFVFENREDPKELGLSASNSHITFVGGAGVDAASFSLTDEPPSPPIKVAVVGRMLRTKGIVEAVEAVKLAISQGANLELHLFGAPDPSNPSSLTTEELSAISDEKHVWWHGYTNEIQRVWQTHHIAMLLSYREGLPNSLVEAAACGRPIITCDVTGCREVVLSGENGFLVPKNDFVEAAGRLLELANNPLLRKRMGSEAYSRFQAQFTAEKVSETIGNLYRQLRQ